MTRIQRYNSNAPVPVKQEQLVNASSFQFSDAMARATQGIGNVMAELGKRKQAADDALAVTNAKNARDLATQKIRLFMADNPDTEKWGEEARKIFGESRKVLSSQRMSGKIRKAQELEHRAFEEQLTLGVEIARTKQATENAVFASERGLHDAIANDDGSPQSAAEIDDRLAIAQKAYAQKYAPNVASVVMEETLRKGKKDYYAQRAKLFPNETMAEAESRRKAIGKGQEDEFGLTPVDYTNIIASSEAELAKDSRVNKAARKEAQEAMYAEMLTAFWDGELTDVQQITEATKSGLLDTADAKSLRTAMLDKEPIETDLTAYAEAKSAISKFATNTVSKDKVLGQIMRLSGKLSPTDGKALVAELFGDHDATRASTIQDGERVIAELLRDKDPITGRFTNNRNQILASADAYLNYKQAMEQSVKSGKTLSGRESYIKAVEIAMTTLEKLEAKGIAKVRLGGDYEPDFLKEPEAERVTVVGPNGKRFTVPKDQIDQALSQGYKLEK